MTPIALSSLKIPQNFLSMNCTAQVKKGQEHSAAWVHNPPVIKKFL